MENKLKNYLQKLWQGDYSQPQPQEAEASWNRFAEKAFQKEPPKVISLKSRWKYFAAAAAVLLVIVSLPFFTDSASDFHLVKNSTQTVQKILLPDNSVVNLQPHSTLQYAKTFQNNRNVKLEGEGYFEVVKNETSPFVVSCNNTTTTVLGTAFTVKSLFGKGTEVALYEGSVKMNVKDNAKSWTLSPGELFVYRQAKAEVVSFDKTTNPVQRHIDFENVHLQEITDYIEKIYGFTVQAEPTILNERITIRVRKDEALDTIIKTITTIYDLNSKTDVSNKEIKLKYRN